MPRFQFPHLFPHPHKVDGTTEVVDIHETLRIIHDSQKMLSSPSNSGVTEVAPGVGVHIHAEV